MTAFLASLFAKAVILLTRLVTAVQARWQGCGPEAVQRIYYANHASHGDFVLIWTVLPPALRRRTRPVAGADYWLKSRLHRFVASRVFRAVFVDRAPAPGRRDPLAPMVGAIDEGASLILFPEGTRNTSESPLLPFKSGLYHLARRRPAVELIPVWIANLNRVLPKGEIIPLPLLCSATFGPPLRLAADEGKMAFLERAHAALRALASQATSQGETTT